MLAIVYFPKTNLNKINSLREKCDLGFNIIPPHITIVSPVSNVSEEEFINHANKVLKDIKSFSIRLNGLVKTPDGCIFLMVKDGIEKIVSLHDELYSGILSPYIPTDYPFTPHITLSDFAKKDDELLAKVYSEAKDLNFDITYKFDNLSIIKGDGLSTAVTVKTITFNN